MTIVDLQWQMLAGNSECWPAIQNVGQQFKMLTRNAEC
jgi:hypothetical protein